MDDYIKRKDALKKFGKERDAFGIAKRINVKTAKNYLRQVPAADVVEVVRCEKCAFWDRKSPNEFKQCKKIATNLVGGIATRGEFYCEAGERKEGNR